MGKMIQLRNVPDDLHRKLKARAAMAGKSLSDYLLDQIRAAAERPTHEELIARLASRSPVIAEISSADMLREERERRGRELERRVRR